MSSRGGGGSLTQIRAWNNDDGQRRQDLGIATGPQKCNSVLNSEQLLERESYLLAHWPCFGLETSNFWLFLNMIDRKNFWIMGPSLGFEPMLKILV